MAAALLVSRLLLAVVFIGAGLAKLADRSGTRLAVTEFGVPSRFAGAVTVALPVAELVVGLALIPVATAPSAAIGAAGLLLCFSATIAVAMSRGRSPECHCFGQVHSSPAGWNTLVRNVLLLAVAGFVAIGGWNSAGTSATHWVTEVGAATLVGILAGIVILALIAFQAWFSMQLLSQNGRVLTRLDALEAKVSAIAAELGLGDEAFATGGALHDGLGAGLSGAGLPVGSSAPDFELESLDGTRASLGELLGDGRRLVLVFTSAGCGPCEALLPQIPEWQDRYGDATRFAVIATGGRADNVAKAAEHGIETVLLQSDDREVSSAYEAHGTPMAVVISSEGVILSPTVGGAEQVSTLVSQAAGAVLDVRHVEPQCDEALPAGREAPKLTLSDLDGEPIALEDLYQRPTALVFWNPGCGFCERMLPSLREVAQRPPNGAPQLVVVSAGDLDDIREQEIRSLVLHDPDWDAMHAFGASGTPMAVLVQDGRVASSIAAGAEAVLALATAGSNGDALETPSNDLNDGSRK
jgi:thiol-disulfide isomerase/thioredoxin/uncharacterized membrane protein YphA (DoxX/SURF4 family)